ncbi:accessory factor UbiK family protein [Alcaligenaceae bacterium]|nr:accessory factor UbiK family protein [Alcaligenaceae bacterium]
MIHRTDWIEDFQKNISELIAKSPAADIERNVKAMMAQTFSRLELVTREEFDVQAQLLERALARITALESRVQALEGRPDTPLQAGPAATGTE